MAEEPDRGPPVPIDYQPMRDGLAFEDRAYCVNYGLNLACSEQRRGNGVARWRIGRDSAGRIAIADRLTGARLEEIIAFEYDTGGVPRRVVSLDEYGRVSSAIQAVDGRPGTYTDQ